MVDKINRIFTLEISLNNEIFFFKLTLFRRKLAKQVHVQRNMAQKEPKDKKLLHKITDLAISRDIKQICF